MADYSPLTSFTGPFTLTAGAAITGGLLVTNSGVDDTVVHTTSSTQGRRPIGVAAADAASGGRVTIWPLDGVIHAVFTENGATTVDGDLVVASTTPGRVTSIPVWSTTGVTSGGVFMPASQQAIGTVVRATTGSSSAVVGVGVTRFVGI